MTKKQFEKWRTNRVDTEYKPGKVATKKKMLEKIKLTAKNDEFEFEVTPYTIGKCSKCKKDKVEVILVEVEGKKRKKKLCKKCADKIFGDCGL